MDAGTDRQLQTDQPLFQRYTIIPIRYIIVQPIFMDYIYYCNTAYLPAAGGREVPHVTAGTELVPATGNLTDRNQIILHS